ncbi:MAG: hypothetical protein ACK5NK_07775 [Niabella sp.]
MAFLFIIVLVLLWVIVRLLNNYFDAYYLMHKSKQNSNIAILQLRHLEKKTHTEKLNAAIKTIIEERKKRLETGFDILKKDAENNTHNKDILASSLKNLLLSDITLLQNNGCISSFTSVQI